MRLFICIVLFPVLVFGQTKIGQNIYGEASGDYSGYSVAMSSDGSIVAIGAYGHNGINGSNSGQVRVYQNQSGTSWTQIGQDIDGAASGDFSGFSVSLSSDGSVVAVGATNNNDGGTSAGQVRVYRYDVSGTWIQIGQDINGIANFNLSGWAVNLSSDGSTVAIGAIGDSGSGQFKGSTRVFQYQTDTWIQIGQTITGQVNFDFSGWSVDLSADGSVLAVGATYNDNNGNQAGNVRIFEYQSATTNWEQIGEDINGENSGDQFGQRVNLSADGSLIAISSTYYNSNTGFVQIYQNQLGTWTQLGQDINGEVTSEQSGQGVDLSSDGSIVAIGAYSNSTNGTSAGQVRVYKYLLGTWTKMGNNINGDAANDWSGWTVALSDDGSKVAIGSPYNDGSGNNDSGEVRVYDLSAVLATDNLSYNQFAVYPNPAINTINIKLNNNSVFEKATIYNVSGQFLETAKTKTIDISHLVSGVYFVEVETEQGVSVKKIIKK